MSYVQLTLPLPPSVSHYYRSVVIDGKPRVLLSREGREYRTDCMAAILEQGRSKTITSRICVVIGLHFPTNARTDIDNRIKPLLDALQHCGVIENDSQVDTLHVIRHDKDAKRPRATVTITTIN